MAYVVFTGGGTGGHVFPGLAVAEELVQKTDLDLMWLGSKKGIESELVHKAEIPRLTFKSIPAGKLRRYLSWENLADVFRIIGAFFFCLGLFIRNRPAVVFSKGGYVTVPPVWAAGFLKIPVVSHESDFDPGLATRLNMGFSTRIFLGYDQTRSHFPQSFQKVLEVSGNPIRKEIFTGSKALIGQFFQDFPEDKRVIIVLGGSLGAVQLNNLVLDCLPALENMGVVIHQHGNQWEAPPEKPGFYYPRAFLGEEIPHVLAAADLALARAGAGTLWELAAWKVPAVVVPLTQGARGDQVLNAHYFQRLGACVSLENPDSRNFMEQILELLRDTERLTAMSRAYGELPTSACLVIAETILELAGEKEGQTKKNGGFE